MTLHLTLSLLGFIYFNSHPHEEDDIVLCSRLFHINISTHILTKRMTEVIERLHGSDLISTHILTKRMTLLAMIYALQKLISTHILTKRMTLLAAR